MSVLIKDVNRVVVIFCYQDPALTVYSKTPINQPDLILCSHFCLKPKKLVDVRLQNNPNFYKMSKASKQFISFYFLG